MVKTHFKMLWAEDIPEYVSHDGRTKVTVNAGTIGDAKGIAPPPNSWAISVLNAYALGGIDKRRELITRAMAFASKTPDEPEPVEAQQPGGFLADIGGQID